MLLFKYFFFISLCTIGYAQTTPEGGQAVNELVAGSKNNLFELSVANSTKKVVQSVSVIVEEAPEWLEFSENKIYLEKITQSDKQKIQFYFNVLSTAPVGEEQRVRFRISDQTGRSWLKSYSVVVTLPTVFEVEQNYPNPFNPSTTIKFSIPQDAFVSVKVFNVLGENVKELVGKDIKTGVHEVVFEATNFSSGFYFYVVEAKGLDGAKYFDSKKMILLK